ncbi:MAG: CoA transferase [Acidimicrobiales bacterium]
MTVIPAKSTALSHIRICDFTGQLAGAGATRWLAALGAQVIRIEDPVRQGKWDILRGNEPFKDDRRGVELGGGFQNHNVEKLGITLNLRTDRGKELLRQLVEISDVVSENFAAGVLERWGFDYPAMRAIKDDIIYVSNCGFGHTGPYRSFRTWGPIVQAACGLTFSSGLPGLPPAGWGYSYMDHHGGNIMAIAILCALVHHQRTGEGQWVDMSCTEAGAALLGPVVLDYTVNGRPLRRAGMPNSNRSQFPPMAPHGIYACAGEDDWVAVSCRDDHDWSRMGEVFAEPWCGDARYATLAGRLEHEDELDLAIDATTRAWNKFDLAARLQAVGVPASAVQKPAERIDADANTSEWGLWPTVQHREMGEVRVDGEPAHLSETDWVIARGAPCLGEHNELVFGELLGLTSAQIEDLRTDGVI